MKNKTENWIKTDFNFCFTWNFFWGIIWILLPIKTSDSWEKFKWKIKFFMSKLGKKLKKVVWIPTNLAKMAKKKIFKLFFLDQFLEKEFLRECKRTIIWPSLKNNHYFALIIFFFRRSMSEIYELLQISLIETFD